jgi:molybdenum cofactor cytidylyltransferase
MTLRVLLLAAGRGRRAHGPKAWLLHRGRPLLERQITFLRDVCPPDRMVVSVQASWIERCQRLDPHVLWVAVDPEATPMGALIALAAAAREQPLQDAWSFVFHVDMPLWETGLFEVLTARIEDAAASGADAILPVHGGRGGHPVLLAPSALRALRGLDVVRDRLDRWLATRSVLRVDVPFPCIHENWNQGPPPSAR